MDSIEKFIETLGKIIKIQSVESVLEKDKNHKFIFNKTTFCVEKQDDGSFIIYPSKRMSKSDGTEITFRLKKQEEPIWCFYPYSIFGNDELGIEVELTPENAEKLCLTLTKTIKNMCKSPLEGFQK